MRRETGAGGHRAAVPKHLRAEQGLEGGQLHFQKEHAQESWGSTCGGRRETQCGQRTVSKGVRTQGRAGQGHGARGAGLAGGIQQGTTVGFSAQEESPVYRL